MPTTVTFDRAHGMRVVTGSGALHATDFIEANREIRADTETANATRSLVDLTAASLDTLTAEDVRAVVHLPPLPRQDETRTAIITSTPVAFGMARMYAILQEVHHGAQIQVFAGREEALAWLLSSSI